MGAACRTQSIPKKVLLVGPKQSGKTTLLYSWCSHADMEEQATLSFNVETVAGSRSGQVLLIFDVTDTIRRRQFFHGTDGIVYVVDGSDDSSIAAAQTDLIALLNDRDLKHLPLLLVVSKQDVRSIETAEIEKRLNLLDESKTRMYTCMSVRKDDKTTYISVLQELCALLYTIQA